MHKEEAIGIAGKARITAGREAYSVLGQVEKRIIEVTESLDHEMPSKVRDSLVWIVTFQKATAWFELAIDDRSGQVIRQRWSR